MGEELRALRLARGLSARALGGLAGVSTTSVSSWEQGARAPRGAPLARLLDALEADERTRARLLHAAEPAFARVELAPTRLGAPPAAGMVIRGMRLRRGTSQADLARTIGATQSTVARWESGELSPSTESVHALCFALGASVEECLALAAASGEDARALPDDHGEGADAARQAILAAPRELAEVVSLGL